jgi:thioredoxin 1
MALITTTSKQDFDDKVLKSDKAVLVDFWAAWCPPCRAMAPILEVIAKEQDAFADVVKVDLEATEDNRTLSVENGVRSIPNMIIFKNGKEVDRLVGVTPEAKVVEMLKNAAAQ